ncbi:MAG: LPS assembly lipoprotein LptE [Planctomycetota bacterium]
MRAVTAIGAVLCLLLLAAGCGYSSASRLPEGVQRLAVQVFRNETFPLRRDLEYDLARVLRQELELRSGAVIVERSRADAVLEGAILSFREGVLAEGPGDTVRESSIDLTVLFRLVRSGDGSVVVESTVSDHAAFSVARGETIGDARREAIREIAGRIIDELEPWR